MKLPPKTTKPTTQELAKALNLGPRRVQQLIAAGMPTGSIEAATAWREAQPSVAGDSAESLRQHRIALLSEQTRRARLAADELEGKLVLLERVDAENLHVGYAVRGALLSMETTLPGTLIGLRTQGEIRSVLHNVFRDVLARLADGEFFRAAGVLEAVRERYPDFTPTDEAERPR